MRNISIKWNQIACLMLAAVMVIGLLPNMAYAAEPEELVVQTNEKNLTEEDALIQTSSEEDLPEDSIARLIKEGNTSGLIQAQPIEMRNPEEVVTLIVELEGAPRNDSSTQRFAFATAAFVTV